MAWLTLAVWRGRRSACLSRRQVASVKSGSRAITSMSHRVRSSEVNSLSLCCWDPAEAVIIAPSSLCSGLMSSCHRSLHATRRAYRRNNGYVKTTPANRFVMQISLPPHCNEERRTNEAPCRRVAAARGSKREMQLHVMSTRMGVTLQPIADVVPSIRHTPRPTASAQRPAPGRERSAPRCRSTSTRSRR